MTDVATLALMRHRGVSWKAACLFKQALMEVMVQPEARWIVHVLELLECQHETDACSAWL